MERDTHSNREVPRDRGGASKKQLVVCLSDVRRMRSAFPGRTCYSVALAGDLPVIVRSRRVSRRRVRHVVVTIADAKAWSQWLADSVRPEGIVIGCVMVQESLTLWLQTPLASVPKAEKVLPALLDVQLPFPLESCHYCLMEICRMPDGTTHALAVVARQESLRARLAAYRARRLNPVLLDHEGLALWTQSREECPLPPDVTRVILHVAPDHVTLVIGRGDRYQNAHSILTDLKALAAGATLDDLVVRLQRVLRAELEKETAALSSEVKPRIHWLVCGAGARAGALVADLHRALAIAWPGPLTVHLEPEYFLARALGARALTRGPLRCNLRTRDLIHPSLLRQARRQALTTAALFLIAGLLLCGLSLTWRLLGARRAAGIQREISALAAKLAPGARIPPGQEVREAEKAAAQRTERQTPFLEAFAPSLAVPLAALIREGQALGVACETLTLQRSGFALAGTSDDWDQCERLALRLKTLGYAVKLERQEAVADSQVHFSVKGETLSR